MGKKSSAAAKSAPRSAASAPVVTAVRNSPMPPKPASIGAAPAPVKKVPPTYESIALRAYYIWKTSGGNSFDNWIRAERELRGL